MTNYYVSATTGSDSNAGTSVALAYLTLTKAASVVAAGDSVIVAPGSYHELLTIATSGTVGNVISWIADYYAAIFTAVGRGVVRLTGAATNEQSITRANALTATTKNYNNFSGFMFDNASGVLINLVTSCTNWNFDKCYFGPSALNTTLFTMTGNAQSNIVVTNSCFFIPQGSVGFLPNATADIAACGHALRNVIFIGGATATGVRDSRCRGFVINNCTFLNCNIAIQVNNEGSAGASHITLTNSIITGSATALTGVASGDIVEDYNNLFGNATDRTNTATGTHSTAFPAGLDSRWFMNVVFAGAGPSNVAQFVTLVDLAAYSAVINSTTSSPTTTDARGTSAIGGTRDAGALEYDSTLKDKGNASVAGLLTHPGMGGGARG